MSVDQLPKSATGAALNGGDLVTGPNAAYRDLFVRQSLKDPDPWHPGGSASPDTIPSGTAAVDPTLYLGDYDQDPGQALVPGQMNFVYVRTRNPSDKERLGQLFVAAGPSTFLCWPDLLTPVKTEDGKPYDQLKVKPGDVGVSMKAFCFTPSTAADVLAAYVFTAEHPVRLPALRSVSALAEFLATTHGYAQRSVGFGATTPGGYRMVGAYDQRDEAADVFVRLICTNLTGAEVALRPIAGGRDIDIPLTAVPQDSFGVSTEAHLDTGFTTTLELVVDLRGLTLPLASARVEISLVLDNPFTLIPLGGHTWRYKTP